MAAIKTAAILHPVPLSGRVPKGGTMDPKTLKTLRKWVIAPASLAAGIALLKKAAEAAEAGAPKKEGPEI